MYPLEHLHKYPEPCEALTQWLLALTQAEAVDSSNTPSFSIGGGQDPSTRMAQSSTRGTSVTVLSPIFLTMLLFRTRSCRWKSYLKYIGIERNSPKKNFFYSLSVHIFLQKKDYFLPLLSHIAKSMSFFFSLSTKGCGCRHSLYRKYIHRSDSWFRPLL